jgi:hypothetical protein
MFLLGFQTRVSVPLRLNHPGTHYSDTFSAGSYLPPPTSSRELESRRRAWWMSVMFDRIVSIGGWLHGVDEQDIGTELPLRYVEFEMEVRSSHTDFPYAQIDIRRIFLPIPNIFGQTGFLQPTRHNTLIHSYC